MKVKSRRFIARYFRKIVKLIYQIKFKVLNFENHPIIILTPGKVGSSSVYKTIKEGTDYSVFHIHRFSQKGIEESKKSHLNSDRKSLPLHLIVSDLLSKKLLNYKKDVRIIVIVREPITREISSFFQNTEMFKTLIEDKNLNIDNEKAKKLLLARLKTDFCKEIEEWFDLEINGNFGVDVFTEDFNNEKKYTIIKHDEVSILFLRMEDLNEIFSIAIGEFLNLKPSLQLKKSNISDVKHYAETYKKVKNSIKLTPETINKIVGSKYFKHFYFTKTTKIKERWVK